MAPGRLKLRLWRLADGAGVRPWRLRGGPARGSRLVMPASRLPTYGAGRHEPHVAQALADLVPPGAVALDVGAHLGYFTVLMAHLAGPGGRVYAFEPAPRAARLLRRTVAANRLSAVTVVPLAAGAETGAGTLRRPFNDAMSHLDDLAARAVPGPSTVPVEVARLDDWAAALEPPLPRLDIVKLDVEGGELAALEGAAGLLRRHRPALICEVHWFRGAPVHPRRLAARLQAAGYELTPLAAPGRPRRSLEEILARLEAAPAPARHVAAFHLLARPV